MFDELKRKFTIRKFMAQIRRYSDYRWDESATEQYVFSQARRYEHFSEYNLNELTGNGTTKEKALRIMGLVCWTLDSEKEIFVERKRKCFILSQYGADPLCGIRWCRMLMEVLKQHILIIVIILQIKI